MENERTIDKIPCVMAPGNLNPSDTLIRDLVKNGTAFEEIKYFTRSDDTLLNGSIQRLQDIGELPPLSNGKEVVISPTRWALRKIVTQNPNEFYTSKKLKEQLSEENIFVSQERVRQILQDFKNEGLQFKTHKDKKIDKDKENAQRKFIKAFRNEKVDGDIRKLKFMGFTNKKITDRLKGVYSKTRINSSFNRLRSRRDVTRERTVRSCKEVERQDREVRALCEANKTISEICEITGMGRGLVYSTVKRIKNKYGWNRKDYI